LYRIVRRSRRCQAPRRVYRLAHKPEDLAVALKDKHSDRVYVRVIPSAAELKAIRAAKRGSSWSVRWS
jgi:hypothetical protein